MAFFTFDRRKIDPTIRPWGRTFDWTPEYMETLIWLDAADLDTVVLNESNTIDMWKDKSGNKNHFTVPSTWNSPLLLTKGINNLSSIRFIKASKHGLGLARPADSLTFFVLLRRGASEADSILLSNGGSSGRYWACMANNTSAGSSDITNLVTHFNGTLISNPNRGQFYSSANGNTVLWSFSGGITAWGANFYLGGYNQSAWYLVADIAEVVITNGLLDEEKRLKVEGYLCHKWGISNNLSKDHLYRNSKPQR
jgi:hypothetical protein